MSTKKAPAENPEVKETAPEAKAPIDPWLDMREITLARAPKGEDNFVLVGIGGNFTRVKRGVPVQVPFPVYERLMILVEAEEAEYQYIQSVNGTNVNIANEADPNPVTL